MRDWSVVTGVFILYMPKVSQECIFRGNKFNQCVSLIKMILEFFLDAIDLNN